MASIGVKMDEEEKFHIFLFSLPNSWDSLVMDIGSNFFALKIEYGVGSLLSEEMRRKVSISAKEALNFHGRSK